METKNKLYILTSYSVIVTVIVGAIAISNHRMHSGTEYVSFGHLDNKQDARPPLPLELLKRDTPEKVAIFETYLSGYLLKTHGPLFIKLSGKVTPDKLAQLQKILISRDVSEAEARHDAAMRRSSAKSVTDRIDEDTTARVKTLLGDDAYKDIKYYEDTLTQRTLVNEVDQILAYKGAPLSLEQREQMIDLIKAEVGKPVALNATLDQVDLFIKSRKEADERLMALASRSLTPVQVEQFRAEFDLQLAYLQYYKMRKGDAMAASTAVGAMRSTQL